MVRVSHGSFSARTGKTLATPTCVWNELIEVPEIRIGEELFIEVWDGSSCCGQTKIPVVEPLHNSDFTEFILQSPSGVGSPGIVALGFQYTIHGSEQTHRPQKPRLFGLSLADLLSQQVALGIDLEIPQFLASCSEAILNNCLHVRGGFSPLIEFDEPDYCLLKTSFNTEESPIFRSKDAPHYILRLFSDWIVSLPAPLLGSRNYDYLIDQLKATSSSTPDLFRTLLRAAIERLTELERHTLAAFCALCEQVAQNHPINRCSIQQVTAQFGRYILWTRHPQTREPIHIEGDFPTIELLVSALIRDWRQIFNPTLAGLYPLGLRFEKFVSGMPIGFTFQYTLVASPQRLRIHSLSKVMSRSQLYMTVLLGSEIRFLNMKSHLFESSISLQQLIETAAPPTRIALSHRERLYPILCLREFIDSEEWLGSSSDLNVEDASSRCIGLWEIGKTPLSTSLQMRSTWVIAFDSDVTVLALPTATGLRIRPIGLPGPFSCGILTPVGLLLGQFDGSVTMLDLGSFQWKTILNLAQNGVEPGPVVLLSPHIRDTNAVWIFFVDGKFSVISLGMELDLAPKFFYLPTSELESPEVLTVIVVGPHIWISVRGGCIFSYDISTLRLIQQRRTSVDLISLANLNENYVVAGLADGRAQIWNTKMFQCCGEIVALSDPIISIAVAKPSAYSNETCLWLASTKTISIWKVELQHEFT